MAEMDQITSGSEPPKKRKKHRRLRLKKLNPFRKKKYKKFTEENYIWDDDLHRPVKKKSKVRRFFSSAARVITFRSLRRKRTTSLPVSLRGRSRYGSTGSLDCLVISDDDESDEVVKGLKRSYSDSELYKKPKDRKKKKLTRKKVKKAGMKAGKLMASGMVQAAGMFQYVTPIPTAIAMGGSQCSSKDSKGTEFIVGFLDTMGAVNFNPALYVVGASRTHTVVNIDAPGMNLRTIIDGSEPYKKIDVTGSSGPSSRAVLVTADHEISVYCVDQGTSMDSYLAIPTDALGTEYYVASYSVPERIRRQDRGSQFLIMGVHANTQVDITLKGTAMFNGRTYERGQVSITVERLQVLHFLSEDDDLTGTHIVSSEPIAVISGNKCADVPVQTSYCDHLVEMIPPVNTWGQHFITSPLLQRTAGDVFRIIASRDNTVVEIEGDGTRTQRSRLNSGEFFEFEVPSSENRAVTASEPALLLQYSKGGEADNTKADPFMMLVPAIEQYPKDPVYFVTPLSSLTSFSHHVNVIASCQTTAALFHNSFQVPETAFNRLSRLRRRVGNHEYCIAQMDLALGEHMLEHQRDIRFSLVLYGFAKTDRNTQSISPEIAYGMPIGLTLNDNTCVNSDSIVYDSSTQRNSRQAEITRLGDPFVSAGSNLGPEDVTAPHAPSQGASPEKSGRYLMLAIMIGMFSLVIIFVLVVYIVVLKKRIKKLEAERKGYNRIQVSSMMVGPDGYIGLDGSQTGERDYMTLNQPQGLWRLGKIRRVNGEIQKATPRNNVNNISSPTPTTVGTPQNRLSLHQKHLNDPSPPSSVSSTQERSVRNPHDMESSAIPALVRQASTRSQPPCSSRHTSLMIQPPHRQSSFRELPRRKLNHSSTDCQINYNSSNETTRPKGSHLRRSVSQTEATAHYCGPKSNYPGNYSVPRKRPLNLALYDRPRKRASSVEIPTGVPPHEGVLPRHDDGYMSMKEPRNSVTSHGSSIVSKDFSPSSPTSGICANFPSSPTSMAPLLDNKVFTKVPDENHNNANDARNHDADSMDYTELV